VIAREQYAPGPASGAQARKDGVWITFSAELPHRWSRGDEVWWLAATERRVRTAVRR
jgi:hypothetical protein